MMMADSDRRELQRPPKRRPNPYRRREKAPKQFDPSFTYVEEQGWRLRRWRAIVEVCEWGEISLRGEFGIDRHVRQWVNRTVCELQTEWDRHVAQELGEMLG